MRKKLDKAPAAIEFFNDPFEALFDDPLELQEARQRALEMWKAPARSSEEWFAGGHGLGTRLEEAGRAKGFRGAADDLAERNPRRLRRCDGQVR